MTLELFNCNPFLIPVRRKYVLYLQGLLKNCKESALDIKEKVPHCKQNLLKPNVICIQIPSEFYSELRNYMENFDNYAGEHVMACSPSNKFDAYMLSESNEYVNT
jgi:hypothetical protein